MTPQEFGLIRSEFLRTKNANVKIWYFPFPEDASSVFTSGVEFADKDFSISIIDQFAGQKPTLLTLDSVQQKIQIKFFPTIVLDSNVVSLLNEFVRNSAKLHAHKIKVVRRFLNYVIFTGYDYNPLFYYIESFSKNAFVDFNKYGVEFAESILQLQTMDKERFIKTGEIKSDGEMFDEYATKYGASNLRQIAERQIAETNSQSVKITDEIDITYAALIQMILLHKTSGKSFLYKTQMLQDFFEQTWGHFLAREFLIGVFYFAGRLDGFISFQKGAHFDNTVKKLYATAWDIFLLRVPEMFLYQGTLENTTLGYVCTGEKKLQYLISKFNLIATYSDEKLSRPIMLLDLSDLSDFVRPEVLDILSKDFMGRQQQKLFTDSLKPKDFSIEEIKGNLEAKLKLLCKS